MATDDDYMAALGTLRMPYSPQYGGLTPQERGQAALQGIAGPAPQMQRQLNPFAIGTGPQAMTPEQGAAMMANYHPQIESPVPTERHPSPLPQQAQARPATAAPADEAPKGRMGQTAKVSDAKAKDLEAFGNAMKRVQAQQFSSPSAVTAHNTFQPVVAKGPAATSYYQPQNRGPSPLDQYAADMQRQRVRQTTDESAVTKKLRAEKDGDEATPVPAAKGTDGKVRRDATDEELKGKRGFLGMGPTNYGGGWK